MKEFLLYIFLISLYQTILFFDANLGVNVILFIIPLLGFLYFVLKKEVINKNGLYFMIPIVLLSSTYFIYDNIFFRDLNVLVIPILFVLMYIYTLKPTYKITTLIKNVFELIFRPLNKFGNIMRLTSTSIKDNLHINKGLGRKIISFLIVLPIVLIVLLLLSDADPIFNDLFRIIVDFLRTLSLDDIIGYIINTFILFIYLGAVINYLLYAYKNNKEEAKDFRKIDSYTMMLLMTILNIIYLIFDFIQIRSLVFRQVGTFVYSEYAREGFFQLMIISFINLIILFLSKKTKTEEYSKRNKVMAVIMVFLTLIIIGSAFYRMFLYQASYGYTLYRLIVYAILITEVIMLIPTVNYIINDNVNLFKYYLVICVSVYTIFNLLPLNYIITKNNIDRYYETDKLDIFYLEETRSADNIPLLIDFYQKNGYKRIDNIYVGEELEDYFRMVKDRYEIDSWREFNISKMNANNRIKGMKYNYGFDREKSYSM